MEAQTERYYIIKTLGMKYRVRADRMEEARSSTILDPPITKLYRGDEQVAEIRGN